MNGCASEYLCRVQFGFGYKFGETTVVTAIFVPHRMRAVSIPSFEAKFLNNYSTKIKSLVK